MRWPLYILLIACCIMLGLRLITKRKFSNADHVELRATYERWAEAGRPLGEDLPTFLTGRRKDFLIDTQKYFLSGTNYHGLIKMRELRSGGGMLVITTNKLLFYLDSSGKHIFVPFP